MYEKMTCQEHSFFRMRSKWWMIWLSCVIIIFFCWMLLQHAKEGKNSMFLIMETSKTFAYKQVMADVWITENQSALALWSHIGAKEILDVALPLYDL